MGQRSARLLGSLIGIAGVAMCLTLLYKSMRSVLAIGGSCASGNTPYVPAHQCPKGTAGTMTLAIFGGLIFLALFGICVNSRGKLFTLLAWPALFLSLGWNFLDYGLNPNSGSGVSAGFLVSAVVFILMGGIPLVWWVPNVWRAMTGKDEEVSATPGVPSYGALRFGGASPSSSAPSWDTTFGASASSPPTTTVTTPTTSTATTSGGGDVANELERLASLHRRGDLTDSEYEAAKRETLK
jgi:hypothetical protein